MGVGGGGGGGQVLITSVKSDRSWKGFKYLKNRKGRSHSNTSSNAGYVHIIEVN